MQSEAIDLLATALAKAQASIRGAVKDSTNPHFKSKYADLSSVWEAWREAGPANDLAVTQMTRIENGQTLLVTQITHKSGQWMRGEYPLKPTKDDPQGMGSAVTYARRYCLAAMVGIAPEDDDGEAASGRPQPKVETTAAKGANVQRQAGQATSAAAEWVTKAKIEIAKLPSGEAMTAWRKDKENAARLEKLRVGHPELYNDFGAWLDHALAGAPSVAEAA